MVAGAGVLDGRAAVLDVVRATLARDGVGEVSVPGQLYALLDHLTQPGDEPEDQDEGEQDLEGAAQHGMCIVQ